MYFESSGSIKVGDNAQIESPPYSPNTKTNGNCFQFWYHMYGNSIGGLKLYIKQNNVMTSKWSLVGDQGERWMIGQISIFSNVQFSVGLCLLTIFTFSLSKLLFLGLLVVAFLDII